jgi:4-hydroxythreonine-4-phosphate dehydrogenase
MSGSRLLITMGDVAGIGPEIIAKAWPSLAMRGVPIVVGDPFWLRRGLESSNIRAEVQTVRSPEEARPSKTVIPCLTAGTSDLTRVRAGEVSAEAGRAAYDFLVAAIDLTMAKRADAIVTAPLHKEGLKAAGLNYPGHTEILAERTGTKEFAMVLWGGGVAVAHVTLHMALRDVFRNLSTDAVWEKVRLLNELLPRLIDRKPRIAVAALNPHGSDGGLFGDEEERIIRPAVDRAKQEGMNVTGPWPADTLFVRVNRGEFDGVVAMYHDAGHIAMKLRNGWDLVNISAGLPIVRTSVAHGTAYDIAGKGIADERSLIAAADAALKLASKEGE